MKVIIEIDYQNHTEIKLTNTNGDTYVSKCEGLQDFFHDEKEFKFDVKPSSIHVKDKYKTGLEKYIEDYFIENSNKYYDKQNAKEYSFKQVIAEYKENQL